MPGQGAPRTCRCIETHCSTRKVATPASQGAPRTCRCIESTSPLLYQFTIASLMGAFVCARIGIVVAGRCDRNSQRSAAPPHPRAPQYGSPAGSSAPPQTSVKRIARCLFRRDRHGRHGRERPPPTSSPELVAPAQAPLMTGRPDTRIRLGSVTCGRGFATLTFQGGGTLCARRCSNTAVRRRLRIFERTRD